MFLSLLHKFIGGKSELGFFLWVLFYIAYLLEPWGIVIAWDDFVTISKMLGGFVVASASSRIEDILKLGPDAKKWFGPLRRLGGQLASKLKKAN